MQIPVLFFNQIKCQLNNCLNDGTEENMATFFYIRRAGADGPERPKYYKEENALRDYAYENDLDYDEFHVRREGWEEREYLKQGYDIQPGKEKIEWKRLESFINEGETIVMKDLSCFPFEGKEAFSKYMEIYDKDVEIIFLDNPSLCTGHIREMVLEAVDDGIIEGTSVRDAVRFNVFAAIKNIEEAHVKLGNKIKGAVASSGKKSGRKFGKFDKLTPELERDIIHYLETGQGRMVDIMIEYNISRNTLKVYMEYIKKFMNKRNASDTLDKKGTDENAKDEL